MSKIESLIDKSKRSLLQQKPPKLVSKNPKFYRWLWIFAVAVSDLPRILVSILAEPL
ncbi:MAG: hypothetical protein V7K26_15760 [Nostoc sp.]|uniref:hypothetical protein n=1 Tax=Nostoc sp. TaxID=1180 RepID=UPI002FF0C535